MRKIEQLDEIKEISLRGLILFDEFCKKHNLKYSLAAGTMIGAVRHKGFIPWDDDIDLFMDRCEYEKLIRLVKEKQVLSDENYEFYIPDREGYIYPFIKIINNKTIVYEKNIQRKYAIGVWIDIFPIDNCGRTLEEARTTMKCMCELSTKLRHSVSIYKIHSGIDILKNIYVFFLRIVLGGDYKKYKALKLSYIFPEDAIYKGQLMWPYVQPNKLYDIYPAEFFSDYTEIEFENHLFMIFSRYEELLEARYGDYMQLPSEENRVAHEFEAYYLD